MALVDLHVHSTASDGTLPPREVAGDAAARGFAVVALTDHDTVDGLVEFLAAAPSSGESATLLVPGIELSVEPGEGFDRFHLLGLGIDPADEALAKFLEKILEGRDERNRRMLENFRRIGIGDIAPEPGGEVLARPHFAKWLVEHGYAASPADAFAKYLLPDSPPETGCYEERYHPSPEEAFRVVHGAGGLCVMAHPKYLRRRWRFDGPEFDVAEREIARLKEAGLDGLEAVYQANSQAENEGFTEIAIRLGLLATAGSDFHGKNKPTIEMGMCVSDTFIAPFMERLAGISA